MFENRKIAPPLALAALLLSSVLWASPCRLLLERLAFLEQNGDFGLAYTTLQPGLRYFDTPDGYLAYVKRNGTAYVLTDPIVSSPEKARAVLADFLKSEPNASFAHIGRSTAALLDKMGFYVNEIGTESVLDLKRYSLVGKRSAELRRAYNRMQRAGYQIRELTADQIDWAQVRSVSDEWMQHHSNGRRKEMAFINRPFVFGEEKGVRHFFLLDPSGRIAGYVFFDPIYRNGSVVGYLSNAKRYLPSAPDGVDFSIARAAIETFQKEGVETLSLGIAPLDRMENTEFHPNSLTSWLLRQTLRFGDRVIENFRGLALHKALYHGADQKVYFASRRVIPIRELVDILRLCHIP